MALAHVGVPGEHEPFVLGPSFLLSALWQEVHRLSQSAYLYDHFTGAFSVQMTRSQNLIFLFPYFDFPFTFFFSLAKFLTHILSISCNFTLQLYRRDICLSLLYLQYLLSSGLLCPQYIILNFIGANMLFLLHKLCFL